MMTEKKLIAEFKENFYKTFGYYPLVFTRNENAIPYMSLEELKKYFEDLDIDIVARGSKKGSIDGRCIFSYIAKEMDYTLAERSAHGQQGSHHSETHLDHFSQYDRHSGRLQEQVRRSLPCN